MSQVISRHRLAVLAVIAAVAFAGLAGGSALGQEQAAAQRANPTAGPVVHRFGCTFQAELAWNFLSHPATIAPIGTVKCGPSTTFNLIRIDLLRNGKVLPGGKVLRGVGPPPGDGRFSDVGNHRWDRHSRYQARVTAKWRHTGALTTVRALSRVYGP